MKKYFTNTINTVTRKTKNVTDIYDNHIRKKAMKITNHKIKSIGVNIDEIAEQDYEAMVNDSSKDIQSDYNKKIIRTGLILFGLDLFIGL